MAPESPRLLTPDDIGRSLVPIRAVLRGLSQDFAAFMQRFAASQAEIREVCARLGTSGHLTGVDRALCLERADAQRTRTNVGRGPSLP